MAGMTEARDEIIKAFGDAFKVAGESLNIELNDQLVIFAFDPDNQPNPDSQAPNKGRLPWARLSIIQTEAKRLMGRPVRNVKGLIAMQVFVRTGTTDAPGKCQELASVTSRYVDKHSGVVNLIGVVPTGRPINGGYAQCDINANYWFTERF